MKILYFSLDYTPHDHRFLSALAETPHQIFYLRLQKTARQNETRMLPPKIEIIPWEGGREPFAWKNVPRFSLALRRLLQKIAPDVVHAGPIQTCAFIAALAGANPLLSMSWGFDLMKDVQRGPGWQAVTQFTLRRSHFFTSDAEVTRQIALRYGMNPAHTVVFPWGVDLSHFSPRTWPEEQPPQEPLTLFCNRSWEPNYGVDVLAQAFVLAAQQKPQFRLLLPGNGSQAARLRQIFLNGGVEERVSMPGFISNEHLPQFYHRADLYLSPSHVDGSSVSLMEALACGLPCLVSDIPANVEWVREGYNGWLFPDGDVQALAAKILRALEERQSLPQIGQNARQTAEEKANWPKNVQKLLETYQQLGKKSP